MYYLRLNHSNHVYKNLRDTLCIVTHLLHYTHILHTGGGGGGSIRFILPVAELTIVK